MGDILENGIYNEAHQCKDSADGTDHPQEMQHNGTASQVKEAPPLPTGRELQDMPRSQKIGRTTCVTLMFFCQGLYISIVAPSLPDFRTRLEATTDQISLAAGCRDAGGIIGCIIGGMLADRFRNYVDLELGMSLFVSGLFAALKPWMPGVPGLACMALLEGVGYGTSDAVGVALLLWIWGNEESVPTIIALIGFPVGAAIAPLIITPFLAAETNSTSNYSKQLFYGSGFREKPFDDVADIPMQIQSVESRIEIPFGIVGGFTFLSGVAFIVYYLGRPIKNYSLWGERKTSLRQVFDVKTCSYGMGGFGIAIITLSCLFWVAWGAVEVSIGLFLYAYAVDTDLGFSSQEASWLLFTYRFAGIIGTLLSILITKYLPIQAVMFLLVGLQAPIMACLATFGKGSKVYFWVFTNCIHLLYIPMYGDFVAWVSKYMVVYSILMSLYVVSYSLSIFSFAWITGYLYETYTPDAILYVSLACGLMLCLIMIALQIVASIKDRNKGVVEVTVNESQFNTKLPEDSSGSFSSLYENTDSVRF